VPDAIIGVWLGLGVVGVVTFCSSNSLSLSRPSEQSAGQLS